MVQRSENSGFAKVVKREKERKKDGKDSKV